MMQKPYYLLDHYNHTFIKKISYYYYFLSFLFLLYFIKFIHFNKKIYQKVKYTAR